MKIMIDIPEPLYNYALGLPNKTTLGSYGVYPMLTDIAFAVKGGQPLPEDAEILTAEAYSELCLMASAYREFLNAEEEIRRLPQVWEEGTGIQKCIDILDKRHERADNDDCMFGDYMSPIV